ncbi:MAG: Asr1405/Asl0597 family protein [Cyanobacteria bacterium P01_D01_bin.1]
MSVSSSTESADSPIRSASDPNSLSTSHVSVVCEDRWQVYHRLQDLGIDSHCGGFQPLQVEIKTPTEALQLWSVLRRVDSSRSVLIASLEQCWRAR